MKTKLTILQNNKPKIASNINSYFLGLCRCSSGRNGLRGMTHPIRPVPSELQHRASIAHNVLYFQLLMTQAVKIE